MRNIKLYDYQDDFSEVEGQDNYVVSIEPGVAYVRENTSVKYNRTSGYDLVVELGQSYVVDSNTSEFINALFDDDLATFKILVTYNGEELCVVDETWERAQNRDCCYSSTVQGFGKVQFEVYDDDPKWYSAYTPVI